MSGCSRSTYYRAGINSKTNLFEFYEAAYGASAFWKRLNLDLIAANNVRTSYKITENDSECNIQLDILNESNELTLTFVPHDPEQKRSTFYRIPTKLLSKIEKQELPDYLRNLEVEVTSEQQQTTSITEMNFVSSMQVLGIFITVLGITTIALAFALLSAATLGVVAALGVAVALSGLGLFAYSSYKNCQPSSPELDCKSVIGINSL
jgi:hypothetical protein